MLKRKYTDCFYFLDERSANEEEISGLKSRKPSLNVIPPSIIPKVQKGLVISAFERELVISSNLPVTNQLAEYEILVKNKCIGLNHVDWKSKKYQFNIYSFPWINGRESSGIVVKRGSKVDKNKFPLGTEVFLASTSYRDLRTSTFQEYTVFDSRLVWRLPQQKLPDGSIRKKFDLEFAAGIGVGLVTAASAIFSIDNLSIGHHKSDENLGNLLIWGGSSSVGFYAIQLAKASKRFKKIVVVSSGKHEKYLKEAGASCIIDRFQSQEYIRQEILNHCPEGFSSGIDVISRETATLLSRILEECEGDVKKLVCTSGVPQISTGLLEKSSNSKLIIEAVNIKQFHEDIQYGSSLVEYTSKLFETGHLKPIKALKIFKNLDNFGTGIINGLKELEEKGASAEKFVVSL